MKYLNTRIGKSNTENIDCPKWQCQAGAGAAAAWRDRPEVAIEQMAQDGFGPDIVLISDARSLSCRKEPSVSIEKTHRLWIQCKTKALLHELVVFDFSDGCNTNIS